LKTSFFCGEKWKNFLAFLGKCAETGENVITFSENDIALDSFIGLSCGSKTNVPVVKAVQQGIGGSYEKREKKSD
jgi:hypothetical protein